MISNRNTRPFLLLLAGLALLLACTRCAEDGKEVDLPASQNQQTDAEPKGSRLLGFHITEADSQDYQAAFETARDAGGELVPLTFLWNTIETDTGWNTQMLDVLNIFYSAFDTKVSLNLTPIYAQRRAMPADLMDKPFDDPEVIARYEAFIDKVFERIPNANVEYVILGLEVDLYLSAHPEEWEAYGRFVDAGMARVQGLRGTALPIGVEATYGALRYRDVQALQELNSRCDAVFMSYYPQSEGFQVRPVSQLEGDIEAVLSLYPDKPLVLIETGYQTSAFCGSSEEKQADYIRTMFRIWDEHATRIPFIGFLWLTDLSEAEARSFVTDYGLDPDADIAFREYLRTCGLRTRGGFGTDKEGFTVLKAEAAKRGWPVRTE